MLKLFALLFSEAVSHEFAFLRQRSFGPTRDQFRVRHSEAWGHLPSRALKMQIELSLAASLLITVLHNTPGDVKRKYKHLQLAQFIFALPSHDTYRRGYYAKQQFELQLIIDLHMVRFSKFSSSA